MCSEVSHQRLETEIDGGSRQRCWLANVGNSKKACKAGVRARGVEAKEVSRCLCSLELGSLMDFGKHLAQN